jgi:hypothetical protein
MENPHFLRTASGGLSAILRSSSYVENDEVVAVKNAIMKENEKSDAHNEEIVNEDEEDNNNEVNRHLGSLLRTFSEQSVEQSDDENGEQGDLIL